MNRYLRQLRHNLASHGFILPIVVIVMMVISLMIFAISSSATVNYQRASLERYTINAQMAADAGFDKAIVDLTADPSWTGSGGEVTLLNSGGVKTTYETTLSNGADSEHKIITAIAKTYAPASSSSPKVTRRYEIDIEAVTSGTGPSSVVSGVGGLVLNSNAKISGGDVVVNGKITIANNAQIGLSTNAVNVRVAHQSCPIPANSTYPRVCNSGENGQPITIDINGRIYGEVHATNQTNGTNMSNPGLVAGSSFAPVPLPDYDRDGQKAAATTTLASSNSLIACGNNQTKTWPANVKITGNFTAGNNCTINITGDVWLTGNFDGGSNARFVISNAVGADRPVLMIDGSGGMFFGNNSQIVPNSASTGLEVITYWSADSSCSPDCTDVTGTALASSQNVTTIDLNNNGSANNSVFYARWSKVIVSNNGGLGAIAGQTVELGNNAVISFTASIPGSDNLITTWLKRGYMRSYQ